MGFWRRTRGHRRKQWVSPGFLSPQDMTPLIIWWRQQQAAAVTSVMVLPWKLFCPTPALPVPTAVVMETGVTADVEQKMGNRSKRLPKRRVSFSHPPSPHGRSTLGTRNGEGFASLKARSLLKNHICPIRQFGSVPISARLCGRWC